MGKSWGNISRTLVLQYTLSSEIELNKRNTTETSLSQKGFSQKKSAIVLKMLKLLKLRVTHNVLGKYCLTFACSNPIVTIKNEQRCITDGKEQ